MYKKCSRNAKYAFSTKTQRTFAKINHVVSLYNFQSPVSFFQHSAVMLEISSQKITNETPCIEKLRNMFHVSK